MASNRLASFLKEQFKDSKTKQDSLLYFHSRLSIESTEKQGFVNESWFSRCFDHFPDFLNKEHPAVKESVERYRYILALIEQEKETQSPAEKEKLTNSILTEVFYLLSKLVYVACSELFDNQGNIQQELAKLIELDKVELQYNQYRFITGYISHAIAAIQTSTLNNINHSWLLSDEAKFNKTELCHQLNTKISEQLNNNIAEAKYIEFFDMTLVQRQNALIYKKNWQDSDAVKLSLALGFGLTVFGAAAMAFGSKALDNPGNKF